METTNKEDTYGEVVPNLQIIKIKGEPQLNSTNKNNNLAVDMQPCNSSCHANTEKCADEAIKPDEFCAMHKLTKEQNCLQKQRLRSLEPKWIG
ncbi:uncharacterized protein LOC118516983 isoform X2 [Anopheles stephensi]|uniref:uncharacterized protein LOC118516983 isoform X2 n=1 Tax=Anopheles stephensi TaxID=30069 RepID=UPI001658B572|nr:uncharacterized protein LOC118516983 isoform X2 [Anopheles stephensi]